MKEFTEITFKNIDCYLIEEEKSYFIKAKDSDNTMKIVKSLSDTDFSIRYKRSNGECVYAHIAYMTTAPNLMFELFPSFFVEYLEVASFKELHVTGDAIDYFFNPAIYFSSHHRSLSKEDDLLYTQKKVASWEANLGANQISLELSYGNILAKGIASDLKLHPILKVRFDETTDFEFINRLYILIRNFLKTIQYSSRIGELNVDIYEMCDSDLSYAGHLHDFTSVNEEFCPSNINADYLYMERYLGRILKLLALDEEYSFLHYPQNGVRYRGRHYSADDLKNIYGAFERECQKSTEIYEKVDSTAYDSIRKKISECFSKIDNKILSDDEAWFFTQAKDYINRLGKQRGQAAKIEKAYEVLQGAIDGSLGHIFYLPESKHTGHLESSEIKALANNLTSIRSKLTHGNQNYIFSDDEFTKIHFLEILTYCQFLKRAGLTDKEIEEVIGVIFGCNYILLSKRLSDFENTSGLK